MSQDTSPEGQATARQMKQTATTLLKFFQKLPREPHAACSMRFSELITLHDAWVAGPEFTVVYRIETPVRWREPGGSNVSTGALVTVLDTLTSISYTANPVVWRDFPATADVKAVVTQGMRALTLDGVSRHMELSVFKTTPVGEPITVECRVLDEPTGSYTTVTFTNAKGEAIAAGTHVKVKLKSAQTQPPASKL